ncbi:MAG: hypothetical protein ACD_75C00272G0005 [uncultured bacterium]|nr:MAG: hypothetical protein ACD_75C00272G0005 [uncultured bacterium]
MDLLQSHGGDTGRRTDDQDRPAGSGTIGHELPEEAVGRIDGHVVHAHGGGNQRHIVDHRAGQTDQDDDDILTAHRLIEPLGKGGKNVRMFKSGNGEQDADKEHDAAHIDALERGYQGQMFLEFVLFITMQHLADQPEDAKTEENAHEWWKMGHTFKNRHGYQGTYSHAEHQVLFER